MVLIRNITLIYNWDLHKRIITKRQLTSNRRHGVKLVRLLIFLYPLSDVPKMSCDYLHFLFIILQLYVDQSGK